MDARPVSPLWLLFRVNVTQSWRRLLAIQKQSRLLTAVIGAFVTGYVMLSFWLFYSGMRFISKFPGLGGVLIERMLFLLFAFLFVMLLFSNLVISYTNLFRNRETSFLLTLPVSAQTVFRWKFVESSVLASWAFLFLIAPLLAAYGLNQGVPWHFYALTVVLVAMFIVLPAVIGSWCATTVARFMDRRAFQIAALTLAACILVWMAFLKPEEVQEQLVDTRVLGLMDRLLSRTKFAMFPLLPSYWLSAAVQQWQEGALAAAGFFVLVLFSHVLFFGFLSFTSMGNIFYDAASTVQSRGSVFGHWEWFRKWNDRRGRFSYPRGFLEHFFGLFRWLPADVRALMVKDVRMFWRDTTQWGQSLMLFGLLGVYIFNLRNFSQQLTNPFWIHLVSFLNLGACALNLATLTTRFVYPQFSLEGKRVWIVGMAPLGLVKIVQAKFWLTSIGSLIVTLGLISVSCHMLKLEWERTLFFSGAIVIMTFTLNGLAMGLGTLYPNLKEENPSKIVSGFGGTFCLVLSFLYIVATVVFLGLGSPWGRNGEVKTVNLILGYGGFAALSVTLGWLPLKLGLKQVLKYEM
ncbi:MAG TPA: hypothetical protein VK968_12520 [Roseimicrobium sp.]|nr:hypothetical protein [Roseimicrobium sp.]